MWPRRSWLLASALTACSRDDDCIEGDLVWNATSSGPLCVLGDLVIEGRKPSDLRVLSRIESIMGSLHIHDNPELTELPPFTSLVTLGSSLTISNNIALLTVPGFPALEEIGGAFYIAENPRLSNIESSGKLKSVGSLFIALNPELVDVANLPALGEVQGSMRFEGNAILAKIALPALTQVGDGFHVIDNPELSQTSLPSLRAIEGQWEVAGNTALGSLEGFSALERAQYVLIDGNSALRRLSWAEQLETREIVLSNNEVLESVSVSDNVGLSAATSIRVVGNPRLVALTGFTAVEALEELTLEENDRLAKIADFSELTQVSLVKILRNPLLIGPDPLLPRLQAANEIWVFGNASLDPSLVDSLLGHVSVEGSIRAGDNKGEETMLDPCPWPSDGICDASVGWYGRGTELCAADPEDCDA